MPFSLIIVYIVSNIVRLLQMLLFVRALMSWFPQVANSQIGNALYMLTEPILLPIRAMLQKIPAIRGMPIDFSVLFAFILLELILLLL